MPATDYYEILGVPRTASQEEIKRAYRRLARQYHPDLHPNSKKAEMEQRFKALNEAYEVLKDPETRKKYDQYGPNWKEAEAYERARAQAGAGGRDWTTTFTEGRAAQFEDLFEELFGARGAWGTSFRGFTMPGADLETSVELSLREVLTGTTRRLTLTEEMPCETCRGSGQVQRAVCPTCRGHGVRPESKTIDIRIPPGVRHGERLRVAGKGAAGRHGGPRGDLFLFISLKPHPVFHREGQHISVRLPVWPWEAALGAEVTVPTLEGPVRMKVPPGSTSGRTLRLKGKGLPDRAGRRGDQYVKLEVTLPTSLTEEEQRLYAQLAKIAHPDPRQTLLREAEA
ncbi:MAG: J domain-containing protein [Nitrospirae bacterium]|nr:MAG: J domain-containing protein [Nitrospirota bacterium]